MTVQVVPAARRLAQEHGVDLSQVQGTGPRGRILIADVENAINAQQAAPAAQIVPISGMRRTIATRMLDSVLTTAQVTLTTEADVTDAMALRQGLSRQMADGSLSPLALIVKAAARALREYPRMNAIQREDEIELVSEVNVGVAVALEEGLMVTTIRQTDEKGLAEIARESRDLATKVPGGQGVLRRCNGSYIQHHQPGGIRGRCFHSHNKPAPNRHPRGWPGSREARRS